MLDHTHAADAVSWIESANIQGVDFPIQNLPYCAFQNNDTVARLGVGIGDQILDLSACAQAGLLSALPDSIVQTLQQSTMNAFMSLNRAAWRQTRHHFFSMLVSEGPQADQTIKFRSEVLVAQADVSLVMPMDIGDFTDYECSHHHAVRMRKIMSGTSKPLANGFYLPRAYHGRASSVVVSGEPIYLPLGQIEEEKEIPAYKPSEKFDYELELGIIIGAGNKRGHPIAIDDAEDNIFGFCLVNDWSARDIQKWERLPLGPFLGKSHATSMSPWIVTLEALAPFRAPQTHPGADWPEPLEYLSSDRNRAEGALDVAIDVYLSSEKMRENDDEPHKNSSNRLLDVHWTISQIVAQHTSGGCNLRPGDLIGSGTISGPAPHESACLYELSEGGKTTFNLPNGEIRSFLQVGDEVTFRGASIKEGYPRIGFGEVVGRVLPPVGSK
ncbi:MAG TPA: fumarylacetoacetase [Gammaproteobacteria bacterium]|jgi:fumarylacetoacetase|nr:fumarylacetoacetase [Pseudomonadota bacterium]HAY46668.1 fumarylacetoacetase [Gammaproteobacteria bacterium]